MMFFRLPIAMILCLIGLSLYANDTLPDKTLIVGVKQTPPFIIKTDNGYSGVSVDLWKQIAANMNLSYDFKEYDLEGLLVALRNNEIDVCINPLTVTSDRVRDFHFTQPFYISSLAIAVPKEGQSNLSIFVRNFFTLDFLKAVFLLFIVIFVFGFFVWLVERRSNPEQFQTGWKGIGEGIWWSAVTMTTVGYGDKAPQTIAGRLIATVWMFTAIIIISSFTASIASSLTVGQLSNSIEKLDDLKSIRAGVVKASSGEAFLKSKGISVTGQASSLEGLEALANNKLDAFVYDEPIMRYQIYNHDLSDRIQILPKTFNTQYYSFSLPKENNLLDNINPLLLEEINTVGWKSILGEYNLE